jgi:hypothetical protein
MLSRRCVLLLAVIIATAALVGVETSPPQSSAAPVVDPTSCQGLGGCVGLGENAVIGPNSCNAPDACEFLMGTVGEGSCNEFLACHGASGDIGNGSCNTIDACGFLSGTVGDASCSGASACHDASGEIGDGSCNGDGACISAEDFGDCEENSVNVPPCNVTLAKSASTTVIPAAGGTPVTYTVRIDFLEDETLNSIEDDQFPALDPATDCELFDGDTDLSLGPVDLPDDFILGDYIICEYTYEPPPGTGEHVNVVTVNVGEPELGPTIIGPGDEAGTWDVSEEAVVLYEASPTPTPPPFVPDPDPSQFPRPGGTPIPAPTQPAPVATQPSGQVGAISPPATGDGGLR